MLRRLAAIVMMALPVPALANDSIAGLGAGGLILGRTDAISMSSEKLSISMDRVVVDYVFRNQTDADVTTIVAFPMPDIDANPNTMPNLPDNESDNFLGFEVTIDGRKVVPNLEQRAFAVGVEVTDDLSRASIPVNPFTQPVFDALKKLPDRTAADWIDRGLIFVDRYDDGSGWKEVRTPLWTLKSTYWWNATFPTKRDVRVSHRYRPSVGASVGVSFFYDGKFQEPYAEYKQKYCMDEAFERAVRKAAKENADGFPQLSESRVDYVLTTGGNWALGNIEKFHLTIDKGDPRYLVSFCGSGVRKTGPTTFEIEATEFYPQKDIHILILQPFDIGGAEAVRGAAPSQKRGRTPTRPAPAAGNAG